MQKGASAGRLAGTVNVKQIRKIRSGSKMGVVQLSDATGQYEAILFSDGLAQYGDLLEAGRSVVITVSAEKRPEGISLRIQTVQSLEKEAGRVQKAMRLYLNSSEVIEQIKPHLCDSGDGGQVSLVLVKDNGRREVEIMLAQKFTIGPHVASMMKNVRGVRDVELI